MAPQTAHISDALYAKHKTNLDLSILKRELESEILFGLFFSREQLNFFIIQHSECVKLLAFTGIECEQTLTAMLIYCN